MKPKKKTKNQIEYTKPELIEIQLLDESAVGASQPEGAPPPPPPVGGEGGWGPEGAPPNPDSDPYNMRRY